MTDRWAPAPECGTEMHEFMTELFPICRSITGEGIRRTLHRIGELVPLVVHEVPTGTPVLDWTVPEEWNISDAWIADASGRRLVDFAENTLHVVSYSTPIRTRMSLAELRPHLHTLPDRPDWIPYRTSYYSASWGFCIRHRTLEAMGALDPGAEYDVCIDSTLEPGHLTYGELYLPPTEPSDGEADILFSCHSCHPSLANDNLSGVAVAVWLAGHLADLPRHHGMRFLFIPGTIGSLTWLARNDGAVSRVRYGLVLSCLGDPGRSTYKRSRRGDTLVDRAAAHVLRHFGDNEIIDFVPYGYDERQYCSPGFDLAVGCLTRTPNGRYPEYHTSADDMDFVRPDALQDSLHKVLEIVRVLEGDGTYMNLSPRGEPQLGRRGLYDNVGGRTPPGFEMALLWVLNLSDGEHSLLDIAERSGIAFPVVERAAEALVQHDLLRSFP